MPERRKRDEPLYRKPTTAKERMTQKLGPAFEIGSIIASAPAGGTVAGFKIASKVKKVYDTLIDTFDSSEVVLISLGTLTFIKPVIQKLRGRDYKSKILQMPFENANGKASYPLEIKREMFKHAYDSFKAWHKDVYFYLCMEDHSLWKEVFGYEYASNNQMEDMMKMSYTNKIKSRK